MSVRIIEITTVKKTQFRITGKSSDNRGSVHERNSMKIMRRFICIYFFKFRKRKQVIRYYINCKKTKAKNRLFTRGLFRSLRYAFAVFVQKLYLNVFLVWNLILFLVEVPHAVVLLYDPKIVLHYRTYVFMGVLPGPV